MSCTASSHARAKGGKCSVLCKPFVLDGSTLQNRVALKIMGPFWLEILLRHLLFRGTKVV